MGQFRFTLDAVLDHRRTVEEQRQRAYSEAQGRVEERRAAQRQIEDDIAQRTARIRQAQSGMSLAYRELAEHWIRAQRARHLELEREIVTLAQVAEAKRQELVKAVQARTIMEQLRDKERKDWLRAEARAEMRVFDEIAVREFNDERRREKDSHPSERIAR